MTVPTQSRMRSATAPPPSPPPPRPARVVRPQRRQPLDPRACAREYEALLLEKLSFVERTVAVLMRRHAVQPSDADDFEGEVKLRLVANDYAVLRKFRGRSRLTTFLTAVVHNHFRDFRIKRWGKWRPSAAARRMGDLGVHLESLLYRDGFGCSEAFGILRDRLEVEVSDAELEKIAEGLRPRTSRRFESEAVLARLQAPDSAEQAALDGERADVKARAERALKRALAALSAEDRLLLRMRYADGLTVRAIAAGLDRQDRQMYARLRRLLLEIRRRVEADGVECGEVLDLLDWPDSEIEPVLGRE